MSTTRRIAYLSGTRADFGLMQTTLAAIQAQPDMALSLYATGMHLDPTLGNTIAEIEQSGLPHPTRIAVETGAASGGLTAKNIGHIIIALVAAFTESRPDIVLLLGDRGEMLAAAIAAIHLNIPVAHIHGGERSGTVDEPVRHAISKLAHLHLVATQASRERLIRMGERADFITVTGAPGLDGIIEESTAEPPGLFTRLGLDAERPVALFLYHPVLQEAHQAPAGAIAALEALLDAGLQVLALKPNSDAGSMGIIAALDEFAAAGKVTLLTHLPRNAYLAAMRQAAILAGNSSSGIIEAASFGTPVLNIGSRQNLRERNANIIDVPADALSIAAGIRQALQRGRLPAHNIYGDGIAAQRIVDALRQLDLADPSLMAKVNVY